MNAEKGYWIAKPYRPPPNPDRSLIPELAYHEPKSRGVERRYEVMAMMDEGPESPAWGGSFDTIYMSNEREHPGRVPSRSQVPGGNVVRPVGASRPVPASNHGFGPTNPFLSPSDPPV